MCDRRQQACHVPVFLSLVSLLFTAGSVPLTALPNGSILSPRAGAVLKGGDIVQLRWTPLPDEIEEFEILLSIDGDQRESIRLTPQMEPSAGSCYWLVPNISARSARIRLRVGSQGKEIECPPSGCFRIAIREGGSRTALRFRQGEWWFDADTQADINRFEGVLSPSAIDRGCYSAGLLDLVIPPQPGFDRPKTGESRGPMTTRRAALVRQQTVVVGQAAMTPMRN